VKKTRSEDKTALEELDEEMVSRALLLMKFYGVRRPMACLLRALTDFDEGKRTFVRLDGETVEFEHRDDVVKSLLAGEEFFCIMQDKKDEEKKKKEEKTDEERKQVQLDVAELSTIRSKGGERR